jgi:membrane fusion protein, multidrug efflux system
MKSYNFKINKRLVVFGVLTSSLMFSCKNEEMNNEFNPNQTIEAEVILLEKDSALLVKTYPAKIEGKNNVEIRPQISGYIDRIYVDEGQYVKAGTPLFKINEGALIQEKNQAIAGLSAAKSQLINAQLDLEKYQNLAENKVMTDFNYRKAKSAYETAKSLVNQQQALIESINVSLSFTNIKAPVNGYLGRLPKKLGALVSPADMEALTTISDVNQVYVYFNLSENDILGINKTKDSGSLQDKLKSFDQINLQLADGSTYALKGKIDMLDGQYNPQTASITVRATFPNPDHMLRSGNTGKIALESVEYDVFKIPVRSTFELQDRVIVGKLNDKNEVDYVPLSNYTKSGDFYIVKTNFSANDRIVAKELARIPEKSVVNIKSKK